mmetsp:Transcript_33434/g.81161  ORF Transcript_33434/g.81161 Transcript_33434/m.81161 type:complete len:85 (-) Transcript_33434:149-403(-)
MRETAGVRSKTWFFRFGNDRSVLARTTRRVLQETFRLKNGNPQLMEVVTVLRLNQDSMTGEKNPPFFRYSVDYKRGYDVDYKRG